MPTATYRTGGLSYDFKELAVEDTPGFVQYMRMPRAKFVALVVAVAPFIKKQETCMRESIQPKRESTEPLQSGTLQLVKHSSHYPFSFESVRVQYLVL